MKKLVYIILLCGLAAPLAPASPLQKECVAADAKWLLHWDLDKFRATKVGHFIEREMVAKKLAKPKADLMQHFNFDFEWEKLTALTAYGTDFRPQSDALGVLIIKTDAATAKKAEKAFMQQAENAKNSGGPVEELQAGPLGIYSINKGVTVQFLKDGRILLGKSRDHVSKAAEVINGKSANGAASPEEAGFPDAGSHFFFLAVAEGFGDRAPLPPNAKILQTAESGRAALGEAGDKVKLSLSLKAKTEDACRQMQQVVQGMVALVSLSQQDNPDLMMLARSVSVTANGQTVTLAVEYPVDKALEKLGDAARKEEGKAAQKEAEQPADPKK